MTNDHDQLDPAEALMREVGAQLRQVRLDRGEELEEVAQNLRIKAVYLFGIEQGDLSKMPGRTYALGFLRSYADYLGFDGDDLIVQIKSTVANLTDRARLRIRTPLPESRLPKTPILVVSLAAIVAIYAGWSYLNRSARLVIETVAEVPTELRGTALDALHEEGTPPAPAATGEEAAPASETAVAAASPGGGQPPADGAPAAAAAPSAAGTGPATASLPAETPAAGPAEAPVGAPADWLAGADPRQPALEPQAGPEQQIASPVPAAPPPAAGPEALSVAGRAGPAEPVRNPAAATAPAEDLVRRAAAARADVEAAADGAEAPGEERLAALSPDLLAAAGQIYEPENTDARVVLRALESSWIQISSLGGDYLRSFTLQQGDVYLVPNRADLELWTGNAGGIEVLLDGAVLAPVGERGAVVREVPLDPPSLRARFGRP